MLMLIGACAAPAHYSTGEEPPGAEWAYTTLYTAPFGAVALDGDEGWAVGLSGEMVAVGDPWTDAGGGGLDGVVDVELRDGVVWALTQSELAWWDGDAWDTVALPEHDGNVEDLVVRSNGDVAVLTFFWDCAYGCADKSAWNNLLTWDGTAWSVDEPPLSDVYLWALCETDAGELLAAGTGGEVAAWDGSAWQVEESGVSDRLEDIACVGEGVVAVGNAGLVVRGEPGALTVERAGGEDLRAVDIAGDGTVWVLSAAAVWHDDGGWTSRALPEGEGYDLAATADGVVVVGEEFGPIGLVGDADGLTVAWHVASTNTGPMWRDPDGAAWMVSGNTVGRWAADGSIEGWDIGGDAAAGAGSGADDVVVVGWESLIAWDGRAWEATPLDEDVQLWDVSIGEDGVAFAVGSVRSHEEVESPVFLRRGPAGWDVEVPPSAEVLVAVHAFAEDDVYALTGRPSQLLHWDGAAWSDLTGDLGVNITVLWGRSGSELYLGGDALLSWDGAAIVEVGGAPFAVEDLAGDDDGMLVAGTDGWGDDYAPVTMLYEGGTWTEVARADSRMTVCGADVVAGDGGGWRRE